MSVTADIFRSLTVRNAAAIILILAILGPAGEARPCLCDDPDSPGSAHRDGAGDGPYTGGDDPAEPSDLPAAASFRGPGPGTPGPVPAAEDCSAGVVHRPLRPPAL